MIQVKSKDGKIVRCELREFEYNGVFMADRTVSATYKSPVAISFEIDDYIEYRKEKFILDYTPSASNVAQPLSYGNALSYDLQFKPESSIELQNCEFLDYVLYDNELHYSPSPKFTFIGAVQDFSDRIKANLDRLYPDKWNINVSNTLLSEDKNIEIDNISCWNALVRINKEFGVNFKVINHSIEIGFEADVLDHTFSYGKGNGLYQIDRNVNTDNAIITRLRAYGGDRNIPKDYNKQPTDIVPKKNLMLPGYLSTGINYIDSENISLYGIREYSIIFEEIYPSIEGVEVSGIGRIDEIVSAEQITDSTSENNTFTVSIKDIGFDINDYLTTETATISIKSGSLIGYEFEIVKVAKSGNGYELTLNKSDRDNWKVPNPSQNLKAGDRFVLLNITMPEKYVTYAEEKLLKTATEYLAQNDHTTYTYNIGVDEIFMARNVQYHDAIREGDKMKVYNSHLNIDHSIIIQSIVITEGGNVPLYKITLSDKPIASTIDKIWDAIENVQNQGTVTSSTSISGSLIEQLNQKYLRKDVPDTAHGAIVFDEKVGSSIFIDGFEGKGWEIKANGAAIFESTNVRSNLFVGNKIGSQSFNPGLAGWGTDIDMPSATITTDNLYLRKNFFANTITYSQVYAVGGSQVVSDVNKIESVERLSDRWRCYIDKMDGLMKVHLRVGDGARIRSDIGVSLIKSLFGRVIEIGSTYFDIAYPMLDGIGEPAPGDFVTRWGNNVDTSRQGLIYSTTSDSGAPFTSVYDGITDITTQDKLKVQFGNISNIRLKNGRQLYGYGAYLNGIWIENSQIFLDNGDTIEQNFFAMNGKFESQIEALKNDMSVESGNILVNSSFNRDLKYWTLSNDVHFINTPTGYLWMDGYFYVEKNKVADIYQDGGKNVLRIKDTSISQLNGVINIPERKEISENGYIYSFALYYKVLRPGTLSVGFTGTDLYIEQELEVSDDYEKLSKVAHWNEKGDFMLKFTGGEILIYGVSLFNDALADAQVYLQTQINQNKEAIKLMATKEYVDGETGKIYTKYDGVLKVQSDLISATVTKIDNINNRIDTAGWITAADGNTLFAAKSLEDGDKIISYINQSATTTTISSSRINLIGAVSFQMFDTSLQNTVNNKLESGDMGELAWKNRVDSSDLAASLATDIANKVNTDALRGYAFNNGADISKSDLADDLRTEITSKLTGSSDTSGNKLAGVIINGQTFIAGGYIQSNFIKADEIFTTTLLANTIKASGLNINDKFIVDKEGFVDMQGKFTASYNGNKIIINPSSDGAKITGIDSNGRTVMNIGFSYYEGVNAPLIEMTYYNSSGQEMGSTRIAPDGASFRSRLNTGGMSTMTIGRSSKGLGMTINATFPTYAQASYGDLYVDGDDVVRIRQEW